MFTAACGGPLATVGENSVLLFNSIRWSFTLTPVTQLKHFILFIDMGVIGKVQVAVSKSNI